MPTTTTKRITTALTEGTTKRMTVAITEGTTKRTPGSSGSSGFQKNAFQRSGFQMGGAGTTTTKRLTEAVI